MLLNYQLNNEFRNKVAIITGASKGIGEAVAEKFLDNGAKCALVSREKNIKQLNYYKKKFNNNSFIFIKADLSKVSSTKTIINKTLKKFKKIDILFNNAGFSDFNHFFKNDLKMYEKTFNTNVRGLFFLMQACAKFMVNNKIRGKIINVSSQAGRRGEGLVPHYCASKAAVISYTQSTAMALAKYKINVNAIAPGVIDTPLWDKLDLKWARIENLKKGEKKKRVSKEIPLGRIGKTEEVAELVIFLSSNSSNYITGQTINIDGGNVMS